METMMLTRIEQVAAALCALDRDRSAERHWTVYLAEPDNMLTGRRDG